LAQLENVSNGIYPIFIVGQYDILFLNGAIIRDKVVGICLAGF